MVGQLNSEHPAAQAAAASGPHTGQALTAQVVERAREGADGGDPDHREVRLSRPGRRS